jgi:hypothetical protein
MGRAALGDTGHSWQVAAGESGTCTRELRIYRPEHSMFAALDSSRRVCLGPTTNTQGLPPNRFPILAPQDPGMHAPFGNVLRAEVPGKPAIEPSFTALVGIDWPARKHDFCLQATGSPQREFGVLLHSPETITLWAKALDRRVGGPIAVCPEIAKGPLVHALCSGTISSCCFR